MSSCFQILSFHVLPTTHSSFLSFAISLWAPLLVHLPLPALLLSLSHTHTLFPFQQPVPVQILFDFLWVARHCSGAPACSFFIAALGGGIELHFLAGECPQFYMHVVATVRLTELKISREEFIAPGDGLQQWQRFRILFWLSDFQANAQRLFPFGGKM